MPEHPGKKQGKRVGPRVPKATARARIKELQRDIGKKRKRKR